MRGCNVCNVWVWVGVWVAQARWHVLLRSAVVMCILYTVHV
jgi:hypothetical protein